MIDPARPFVLLDDARPDAAAPARLYQGPVETVEAATPDTVGAALARLDVAVSRGFHAAGFLSYEAGHALEDRFAGLSAVSGPSVPLLWFGLFETFEEIAPEAVSALLPDPAGGWTGAPEPGIARTAYESALDRVQAYIAAGDIYQANLTFPASVRIAGAPLALYAGLRARARAGYGGIVHTGRDWLLSLSPELFFALKGGRLTTRPMKGTATRGLTPDADAEAIRKLRDDPKQRAENLMIVDLLRNDLSRVSKPGSVAVPALFAVETYPTVHQMTSTVTARLAGGLGAIDVIRAIYPCGSITGAPKIRAMEVIAEVEPVPRHAYTGSIGRLDPGGDAAFNVAIRTLHLAAGEDRAVMGLGSGIVADSQAGEEWRECLAKGAFVASQRPFDVIETMAFDPVEGVQRLERHLARMKASAEIFGFAFDRHGARNELQAATFRLNAASRIRMLLARSGRLAIEIRAAPLVPAALVDVALVPLPVASADFRLRHKTTDRAFYDKARNVAGTFEVVLFDTQGFLTEGSFTNIFVERHGTLLTPPASRGLLPGVLRAALLDEGRAIEADLRAEDLAEGLWIGNAARGLIAARFRP